MEAAWLQELRDLVQRDAWRMSLHAMKRLDERGIRLVEVIRVLLDGEVVEYYADDHPYPSALLSAIVDRGQILFVVCAVGEGMAHVITAHWLDPERWLDPRTRRER